jgi:RAT1-interacting protein
MKTRLRYTSKQASYTTNMASSLPPRPPASPDSPLSKRRKVNDAPNGSPSPALPAPSQAPPVRFPIQPLNRFRGASASVKRPREIAHFSYDDNHEYRPDDSGISYYHPPQMGSNLCNGFDTFRHYEEKEDPHLDSLLRTLAEKERKEGKRVEADFVTWRGMMTKIMTAPFDHFAAFEMRATLYNGTIYLEEDFGVRTADRAAESRPSNPNQPSHEMMSYWGYKFETLCMLPDTAEHTTKTFIESRPQAVVSNHAQHCSIVHTAIGSNTLILGGEVDGLWSPKPSDPERPIPWVELKTAEELPPNPQQRDILKYERKLLKFWAQSFLLGVEKVIVGFRSKQGILRAIDIYETGRIPGMVRRGTACWDGNTCINFAAAFLDHLKRTIVEEGVYNISLKNKSGIIEIRKVQEQGTGDVVSEPFLDWRTNGTKATKHTDANTAQTTSTDTTTTAEAGS